jgi:CheY-like chemotaxis protein
MPIELQDRTINRVLVVDDNQGAREAFSYPLEELGLVPVQETGPLPDTVGTFVSTLAGRADAVFCDYRLRPGNYSSYDGDELVAACYQNKVPAILCTTYSDADFMLDRRLVRFIPVLLRTGSPEPADIDRGFRQCADELQGDIPPSRRPWRALIRVHAVDRDRGFFYVVIPGWNVREKVRLALDHLPQDVRSQVEADKRLHAQVNIGSESYQDLYFYEWESG